MDIKRKLEIVETAINSLATHSDEDSVVLLAALDRIQLSTMRHKADIERRVEARAAAALKV